MCPLLICIVSCKVVKCVPLFTQILHVELYSVSPIYPYPLELYSVSPIYLDPVDSF